MTDNFESGFKTSDPCLHRIRIQIRRLPPNTRADCREVPISIAAAMRLKAAVPAKSDCARKRLFDGKRKRKFGARIVEHL